MIAAERIPELRVIHSDLVLDPSIEPPQRRTERDWTRDAALVEIVRGRLTISGPTTADAIAVLLGVVVTDVDAALLTLEADGVAMRGHFEHVGQVLSDPTRSEWCDRTLLARIHRYTLDRLRADIEPVSPADFMRFLFVWQHADPFHRLAGVDGLRAVVEQLDGFDIAADAWERTVLPLRVDGYEASMLDTLCLTGEVAWGRRAGAEPVEMNGATPIALFMRDGMTAGLTCVGRVLSDPPLGVAGSEDPAYSAGDPAVGRVLLDPASAGGSTAQDPPYVRVLATLRDRGPSFAHELARLCTLTDDEVRSALGDLVSAGFATADGFGGLRWLLSSSAQRSSRTQVAGRWSAVAVGPDADEGAIAAYARMLLGRYGVVCRRLLVREARVPKWRDLVMVYRRMEARGEIRGGRFVSGLSGEQFARADAVERLREIRRTPANGRLITISAADPLNLAGIVTAGERVRAVPSTRIVYRDGQPVAALEGDYMRPLADVVPDEAARIASALTGRTMPAVVSGYVGR